MDIPMITDEQRRRWDICRVKKNRCEKILGLAMAVLILNGIIVGVITAFSVISAAGGNWMLLVSNILALMMLAAGSIGVYKRSLPVLIASVFLWGACCITGSSAELIAGAAAVGAGIYAVNEWNRLRDAEGFPDFDIQRLENAQKQQAEEIFRTQANLYRKELSSLDTPDTEQAPPHADGGMDTI